MKLRPGVDRNVEEFMEHVIMVQDALVERIKVPAPRQQRIQLIGQIEALEWGAYQYELSPIRAHKIDGSTHELTLEWIAAGQKLDLGDPWVEGIYDALHWMIRPDGERHKVFLEQHAGVRP